MVAVKNANSSVLHASPSTGVCNCSSASGWRVRNWSVPSMPPNTPNKAKPAITSRAISLISDSTAMATMSP